MPFRSRRNVGRGRRTASCAASRPPHRPTAKRAVLGHPRHAAAPTGRLSYGLAIARGRRHNGPHPRMSGDPSMHAALVSVNLDPAQIEQAKAMLNSNVVPMVKAAPGFVAGYWLEPVNGKGYSVVLFETEAQARESAPPA